MLRRWAATAELQRPVGAASIAFAHDVGDFVPEGIVLLDGDLVMGSVRHGRIVRIGERVEVLSNAETAGHWSVFGMRLGPDNAIWFVSAAVPEYAAVDAESLGTTGLFRLDPVSGAITERAILPRGEPIMVLGDLVFADADTIYLTESLQGALYRYTISSHTLQQVIAPGALRSMQGLVLDKSGDYLYVADGRAITQLRILARNLAEFDEPTLGTIVGDDFLFVANSHWNRFDTDVQLPGDLQGPIILRISLRQP